MPLVSKYVLHQISLLSPRKVSRAPCPVSYLLLARNMSTLTSSKPSHIQTLQRYTACDISDALLKLKIPNCGFLPDLKLYTPTPENINSNAANPIIVAPASTVQFVPRSTTDLASYPEGNIPNGRHWVDLTEPDTIVIISQPRGQICAVLGGIMALRMKVIGAKGVVAYGRVRDLDELRETELPVSFVEWWTLTLYIVTGTDWQDRYGQRRLLLQAQELRLSHTLFRCLLILMELLSSLVI